MTALIIAAVAVLVSLALWRANEHRTGRVDTVPAPVSTAYALALASTQVDDPS